MTQVVVNALRVTVDAVTPGETQVVQVGFSGPQGPRGLPGEPGPTGGDLSYRHDQSPAAAEWVIDHNLNKWPSVTVVDSAGDEVEGDVNFVSRNRVVISFSAAFSGSAFVN